MSTKHIDTAADLVSCERRLKCSRFGAKEAWLTILPPVREKARLRLVQAGLIAFASQRLDGEGQAAH